MRYINLCVFFLVVVTKLQAQDPMFSQFYAAPMFVNPAFAADKQTINLTLQHRMYANKVSPYMLSQFTGILPLKIKYLNAFFRSNHQSGAAFTMYRSASGSNGEMRTFGFLGTFAQNIQIMKSHYLSMGIQAGYMNLKQGGNFMWGSQYNENTGYDNTIVPSLGELKLASNFPSVNFGMVWFMNNTSMKTYLQKYRFDVFGGFSVYNLNRPNISFFKGEKTRLPMNYKVHGGVKTFINQNFYVYPNFMYMRQNNNNQFLFGSYVTYKPQEYNDEKAYNAIAGIWYRVGESIILSVGSSYYNYRFTISYDIIATNKFSLAGRGKRALEFSLKYSVPTKKQHLSRGQVYPSF